MWLNPAVQAAVRALAAKWETTGTLREWSYNLSAGDKPQLVLRDESAGVNTSATADTALTEGSLEQIVVTYDGGGGATAADGMTFYKAGAADTNTTLNNASYVAMEAGSHGVAVARRDSDSDYFSGAIHGGFGFVKAELTADEVRRLYAFQRGFLGV
jgi:hypothetical protein